MSEVPSSITTVEQLSLGVDTAYGREDKQRGAIFTRESVVDFILDMAGYLSTKQLYRQRLLEPSFGDGRFILHAVDRLIDSWKRDGRTDIDELSNAIRAVELDNRTYERFAGKLTRHLTARGIQYDEAQFLVGTWLLKGDYLLTNFDISFDYIVGNPPYIRQELIDTNLLVKYKKIFSTMVGRADIYIAFIERSLSLLSDSGKLSFICADAWVKNDYGKAIRSKIASNFNFKCHINMYGLDAFEVAVGAYPSVIVIERGRQGKTKVVRATSIDKRYLEDLAANLSLPSDKSLTVQEMDVVRGSSPWLVGDRMKIEAIQRLESLFPTLQDAGCRVGIGVATGADRVFIAPFKDINVENDRKLPLATNKCTHGDTLLWSGKGVINPWDEHGKLVDLDKYPLLSAYLEAHRESLSMRHTARSDVSRKWYKTIDRITPSLMKEPKLLIPDIKGNGDAITFDSGTLYPHHNLYFITSVEWDLRALQALLRSGIAYLFVEAYSVKIGGGYLRFQAQNLKRIRIPYWQNITHTDRALMIEAGRSGTKLSNDLIERIYKLQPGTMKFLREDFS